MKYIILAAFFILSVFGQDDQFTRLIYDEINQIRAQQNPPLPAIRWSPKLGNVAKRHTNDLSQYRNRARSTECNLHSWYGTGACCYQRDHSNTRCMWDKPKQLSGYSDSGYEIAYDSGDAPARRDRAAAKSIVNAFMGSSGHRDLILSRNQWRKDPWMALGVGNTGSYTTVWFGKVPDSSSVGSINRTGNPPSVNRPRPVFDSGSSQINNRGKGNSSQNNNQGRGNLSQNNNRGKGNPSQNNNRGKDNSSQNNNRGKGNSSQNNNRGQGNSSRNNNRENDDGQARYSRPSDLEDGYYGN